MKFVRGLENMFEKYIEGFFNSKFSSGLQPIEIGKQLVRSMEDEKTVGISKTYVPNLYMVYLNDIDYNRISSYSQSISQELSTHLMEQAKQRKYTIIGMPIIEFYQDESVIKGSFRVVSCFSEPLPDEKRVVSENIEQQEISDTRVFDKVECNILEQACLHGKLRVLEGPDAGVKIEMTTNRVNIGRRASNELPLTDLNTSRLQAYVIFEDGNHVIYDAKSLNGTYVNDHRISCKELTHGDHIKIGNTVILYEVN
ncbi:DUF3662 and FHA domain-containing protein [Pelosinus sp. IPA-1]|uniref:DUF3662 and FHA domain-containing protein n=1 Tax=Pelosinus sp. IPA-1 TaxID=3029569 RepID=UPI00243622E1|nr:DUF3662 and FHA domain-containing protein [Pelosinus sp. IPA-1]GMA99643.1 phosphopeptide-binding protein [Pelosinus sp. IPA-1]